MGIETGIDSVCPECEGALMKSITDTKDECPRCGHLIEENKMKEEYEYKYEITLNNKEDVETLFTIVEKMGEGSNGAIKPLDDKSFQITTEILEVFQDE